MRHTDQGYDVRPRGQRIGEETARVQIDTGLQPRRLQGATGDFEHRRQVKQRQLQVRILAGHGADEAALATTHIHQAAVACERVAAENFLQHKVLGRGHQLGVAGHGLQRRASGRSGSQRRHLAVGIGPIPGHAAAPGVAQEFHRLQQVLVEQIVVLDHGCDAVLPGQGRAQRP